MIPVVIGISWNEESGHAMLAVGYEEERGRIAKILCLDPGDDIANVCKWNAYIDTDYRRGRYCCKYIAVGRPNPIGTVDNVTFEDYFYVYTDE